MTTSTVPAGALEGLRVLDLGGEIANYCGRLFAQLGADVILVEPSAGSSYRAAPPLTAAGPGLRFAYDNADKQSIGVDLTTDGGRDVLTRLAGSADLLLDDRTQHDLSGGGFAYDTLAGMFPTLTTTVITPFGLSGPYAHYAATDATCMAFGGMLWLGGYADGPPVQPAGHQSFRAGSLFAAVASMAALLAEGDERGEFIDVSVQECVSLGLENAIQFYDLEGHVRRRHGGTQKQAGFGVFPCADGFVFLIAAGIGGNRFWKNFVDWMASEHVADAHLLAQERWGNRDFVESTEAKDLFASIFTPYSSQRSKEELLRAAIDWNVPLSPVMTMSEVHRSEQLRARDFFSATTFGAAEADAPGAPYRLDETPWRHRRSTPTLGQHTQEILSELGFSATAVADLRRHGAVA